MEKLWMAVLLTAIFGGMFAQGPPVREDDEFWKKRVVRRLDLGEKINRPLVTHASTYDRNRAFTETNGIVAALVNGLKRREYVAYGPDDWNETLTYEQLVRRMMELEQASIGPVFEGEEDAFSGEDYQEFGGEFGLEGEQTSFGDADDWGDFSLQEEVAAEVDEPTSPRAADASPTRAENFEIDWAQYEQSIHIVEDWIFNTVRSSMQQDIDFFEIIWTDPSGMLPEEIVARFLWEDVEEILGRTQWRNRFNEAECRSVAEVMEMRMFHGYVISIGGLDVRSLSEADQREREMIEFEHNLWSY